MLGKIEGRRGWQRVRWLEGITDSVDTNMSKLEDSEGRELLASCSPSGPTEQEVTEQLNNTLGKLGQGE